MGSVCGGKHMTDITARKKRIVTILDANGVDYAANFKRSLSQSTPSAQQAAELAIRVLEGLIKYGVNNGFSQIDRDIEDIVEIIVDLSESDKEKRIEKRKKELDKCVKGLEKSIGLVVRASGRVEFVRECSMNISLGVINCLKETMLCTDAILDEIVGHDDEQYARLFRIINKKPSKSIDEWKEDSKAIVSEAKALLSGAIRQLEGVLDDSSEYAKAWAEDIKAELDEWRNELVYCYLMLDRDMLIPLKKAVGIATEWAKKVVGVSGGMSGVKRAKDAGDFNIYDQLFEYEAHNPSRDGARPRRAQGTYAESA